MIPFFVNDLEKGKVQERIERAFCCEIDALCVQESESLSNGAIRVSSLFFSE